MPTSKEMIKSAFSAMTEKLETLGFKKRKPDIFTMALSEDVSCWVGLNKAVGRGDDLEINPTVGVRNQKLERKLAELLEEPFNELSPPTLAGNIGYLSPSDSYKPYRFSQKEGASQVASEMAADISSYGLRFAQRHVDLPALVEAMQGVRFGVPEQLAYRIPVALCLLDDAAQVSTYLRNKLNEIGDRTDPAAVRYKVFAQRVREQFNLVT